MIYAYIRCSTDHQNTLNQKYEIEKFAASQNLKIDIWEEEVLSATTDFKKRKLHKLLCQLKKGDILISTELSRLGRNLLQVMSILHNCMNRECQVWTIKENYKLGADIQSKVLAFAFSLSAEIERNLISQKNPFVVLRLKVGTWDDRSVLNTKNLKNMQNKFIRCMIILRQKQKLLVLLV